MPKPKTWVLPALVVAFCAASTSANSAGIDDFVALAHRTCPSRHLEHLTDGGWFEIMLDGKGPVFSASAERGLAVPYRRFSRLFNCANLPTVDCDTAARASAIQSRGLMSNAVQQICRDWQCKDEATCAYAPQAVRR